ncbi:MAG: metalloendopeptidase, glycoprotease family [Deltaproteobacteria bacterium]|nr:metalloendopeptidase, glycoprotease family [Deltaproteobacteria bacterium]
MLLLCIETSCDETAAAVVRDGRAVLASIVSSQIDIHAEYGGVVPEIASRKHLEAVLPVVDKAIAAAGITMADIEGVTVTRGPGLVGALLVGVSAAKGIALGRGLPLAMVNHIEAHLLAVLLEQEVEFPFVALAVSGGHTHLYEVKGIGSYRTLGQTIDDAAGEAFDKVAKLVGIPYPGGAVIDSLAKDGNPAAIAFPRPLLHDGSLNFSFSGLKTSVLNHLRRHPDAASPAHLPDLCASFQAAVCQLLVAKAAAAVARTGCSRLVVAGGVACNSGLRHAMQQFSTESGCRVFFPSPALCADNAAMLAVPGDFYLSRGLGAFDTDALPNWPLDQITAELAGTLT